MYYHKALVYYGVFLLTNVITIIMVTCAFPLKFSFVVNHDAIIYLHSENSKYFIIIIIILLVLFILLDLFSLLLIIIYTNQLYSL